MGRHQISASVTEGKIIGPDTRFQITHERRWALLFFIEINNIADCFYLIDNCSFFDVEKFFTVAFDCIVNNKTDINFDVCTYCKCSTAI